MKGMQVASTLTRPGRLRFVVRVSVTAWQVALVVLALLSWEAFGRAYPLLLSYPTRVVLTFPRFVTDHGLLGHLGFSLATLILGYILAFFVALAVGILLGTSRLLGRMAEPYVYALYATPRVALVPLIVLWFGIGYRSVVFTLFLLTVFPIMIATMVGVRNADSMYLEVARAFRLSRLKTLTKVVLPGAVPFVATGMRIGAGRAVTGLIIGEMFIRERGIGRLLDDAETGLIVDQIYALVILIAVIGAVFPMVFKRLEQRLSAWRPATFDE